MMDSMFLIAKAADTRFAISAARIENVVRQMDVVPVPLTDPCVAGISSLRSKVVTVIDLMAAITGAPRENRTGRPVIVAEVDGSHYGFIVDRVCDIIEAREALKSVEASMSAGWRAATTGFIETDDGAVIVVDPGRLISPRAKAA